jgi:periplasmic protein TonB
MSARVDILDQREPLGRWFVGSVIFHLSILVGIAGYTFIKPKTENWGEKNGGGMGSIAVNVVSSIRLPTPTGPTNPVANDTESHVPTPPPKAKALPKPKPAEPVANAIPLKSEKAQKARQRAMEAYQPPNTYRAQQHDAPNQLYSHEGQEVSTNLYAMTGGGGVGVGTDSPLGTRFGYYATIIRNKVAQNWHVNDVDARVRTAPEFVVRFTLRRDGSVVPGSAKVVQGSGIGPLDISAQRAILDASPFGPLPSQFEKDQADLELHFLLRR